MWRGKLSLIIAIFLLIEFIKGLGYLLLQGVSLLISHFEHALGFLICYGTRETVLSVLIRLTLNSL